MAPYIFPILTFCLTLVQTVVSQTQCGPRNTNPNCTIGVFPSPRSTIYYSPSDTGDIEVYSQSEGGCDPGSYMVVNFYNTTGGQGFPGTFISSCGCLPLDGNLHGLDCGVNKGQIPEGTYQFTWNDDVLGFYDPISITHSQVTSTAATPTTTVTATTYESTEVTTTQTVSTTTTTTPVTTSYTPTNTVSSTSTVTPSPVTTTVTSTKTKTKYQEFLTVIQATSTRTAPCTTVTPKPCLSQNKNPKARDLVARQNDLTAGGDGPLTTTVTPSGVVVTQTVDGGTTTDTDTVTTTTTLTSTAPLSTTTVGSGSTTVTATTTLAAGTSTISVTTTTTTTKKYIFTFSWIHTTTATPTCLPTKSSH